MSRGKPDARFVKKANHGARPANHKHRRQKLRMLKSKAVVRKKYK